MIPTATRSIDDPAESSPRSTVLAGAATATAATSPHHMTTTNISVMNDSNLGDVVAVVDDTSKEKPSEGHERDPRTSGSSENPAASPVGDAKASPDGKSTSSGTAATDSNNNKTESKDSDDAHLSPQSAEANAPSNTAATGGQIPGYPSHHLTPQPGVGYYVGYPHQSQVTPEPPSPAAAGATTVAYDTASFVQQHGAFAPFGSNTTTNSTTPLSPPRASVTMGVVPPTSPLFPRVGSGGGLAGAAGASGGVLDVGANRGGAPPSPNLPAYMSPQFGTSMYHQYPAVTTATSQSSDSQDEGPTWAERAAPPQSQPSMYQQSSPIPVSYGVAGRAAAGGRAYSFEETMLPPSVLDPTDQAGQAGNPAYSPYGGSQSSPIPGGAALFAHQQQQPWMYGGPQDMYNTSPSPLQPRPSPHGMGMYGGGMNSAAGMRSMAPYGQYYPASSPGPPIQTTASNKGPDGANLFIFHIPNHFTNLDMYQLFFPYGTLLSVRIMVEKDTGRSRGFGFVSYDSPESAAVAIKELNGFPIGNKRLKVQHKQIRPKDVHNERDHSHGGRYDVAPGDGGYQRSQFSSSSLPPSGPMATQNVWYDDRKPTSQGIGKDVSPDGGVVPDEGTELTSTSTGGETPLQLGSNESPLASLGSLQNALPDVSGHAGAPE